MYPNEVNTTNKYIDVPTLRTSTATAQIGKVGGINPPVGNIAQLQMFSGDALVFSYNNLKANALNSFWNNRYFEANDPQGTNHDGTITNAALTSFWGKRVLLKPKQLANFDGNNSYIQLANSGQSSDFDFGSDNFTLEGKTDLTNTSPDRTIISRWNGGGNQRGWLVRIDWNGGFQFLTNHDGGETNNKRALVEQANVPQRVTNWKIVKTGTTVNIYFDGVQQTVVYSIGSGIDATIYSNTANTIIGGRFYSTSFIADWDKEIYFIKVTNDTSNTVVLDMDFSGIIGTTTVTSSHVGTNHDGTIVTSNLVNFWSKTVIEPGHALVSADYAVGVTHVSTPFTGVHNGSECSITLPTAGSKTYAELLAVVNTHPANNQLFVRKESNGNIKAIVELPSAASAGAKEEILNYVGQ